MSSGATSTRLGRDAQAARTQLYSARTLWWLCCTLDACLAIRDELCLFLRLWPWQAVFVRTSHVRLYRSILLPRCRACIRLCGANTLPQPNTIGLILETQSAPRLPVNDTAPAINHPKWTGQSHRHRRPGGMDILPSSLISNSAISSAHYPGSGSPQPNLIGQSAYAPCRTTESSLKPASD